MLDVHEYATTGAFVGTPVEPRGDAWPRVTDRLIVAEQILNPRVEGNGDLV